jgi:UDP-N-acetyl-2-amino-2-deoxyglucuronate dehydrogenase
MIKFALVGCGRISKRHSELLGENQIAGAQLVAVCDKIVSKAEAIADKYSVPAYACLHEMMKTEKVDVVVVLTQSGLHAQHTIDLAPYGAHVVVEKPMALTIDDADSMIEACDQHGVKLFVVKQNRFNVPVLHLRKALDQGRFGKLFMGTVRVRWSRHQAYYDQDPWRGTWAMDGGVLTNQASHHIDLLQYMFGVVDSVYAKGITALANIEAEDTAAVILKFRSGALGIIEATTAIRPKDLEGSLSILGEKGSAEIGGFAVNKMLHWNFQDPISEDGDVMKKYSVNPPNVYGFGHQAYYDHVVESILENKPHMVDGLQGRKSVELISAIYESMETRKEIFLRFRPEHCKLGERL